MKCLESCSDSSSPSSAARRSPATPGVAIVKSEKTGVVSRVRAQVKGLYTLVALALIAFSCQPLMAQTPATFDDVPTFFEPAAILSKLVSAVGTIIAPVILFLLGVGVAIMFMRWLMGSKKVA